MFDANNKTEVLNSFHTIIAKLVPDLFEMVKEIRSLQNNAAMFNSIVLPSWYQYYEIPLLELFSRAMSLTDSRKEVLEVFSSENPYQRAYELIKPKVPYAGYRQPQNLTGNQLAPVIALVKNFESILYNKTLLNSIIQDIKDNGDLNGTKTKQVLSIDRTAIHCETISKKLQDAQFIQNEDFLKSISNSFPIKERATIRYPQLTFAIYLLLDFDMYDLMTEEEREELLMPYYSEYREKNSFHRECNRIRNEFETQKSKKRVGE